jgi:predicted small secreted protein
MELCRWNGVESASGSPESFRPVAAKEVHMTRSTLTLKKILLVLATGSIAIAATACNTVKGAGRDIESVGKAGDEAIN